MNIPATILLALVVGLGQIQAQSKTAGILPDNVETDRMRDWCGLKYGMFLHFGMSTFTGNELDPGDQPSTTYAPKQLDVDQWIRVARQAGMKYAVLTSKHVAGHCLWDSKVQFHGKEFDYDVATSGNTNDVVRTFVGACQTHGITPGLYYCLLDFHNNSVPQKQQWGRNLLPEEFYELAKGQLTELARNYPAVRYYWLDIPRAASVEQRAELYDLLRRENPGCVVMFNCGFLDKNGKGAFTIESTKGASWPTDVLNSERDVIPGVFNPTQTWQGNNYFLDYEHCDVVGKDWFWTAQDKARSTDKLFEIYSNAVNRSGGNLLLDVGPNREGRLDDWQIAALMSLKQRIDSSTNAGLILKETNTATVAVETSAQRAARMAWWRDARFGMFIHWDMSSIAGTEISWSRQGSRPLDNGSDPAGYVADPAYDNLYKTFNPTNLDAKAWVRLAKSAGMKYIVFTAKHHGGFCMWDTKLTEYSIMNTPFHRDVVKELVDACHAAGLKFGIYYSQRDWHHPDYGIGDNQKYSDYMNGQLRELLTNYGQVDILWFDSYGRGDPLTFWRIPQTWSLIKTLQPQVLINNRLAALRATNNPPEFRGDFDTPEKKLGSYNDTRLWESCMTVINVKHGGWSYRPDGKVKSAEETLHMLVSCATGDGNLLLDVGPDATGLIPADQSACLVQVGEWLKQNGESIYGTRGGPFKPGKYGGTTRKGKTIYVHVVKWPESGALKLPNVSAKLMSARLLTEGKVDAKQTQSGLEITVPESSRQKAVTVTALEFDSDVMKFPAVSVPVVTAVAPANGASVITEKK